MGEFDIFIRTFLPARAGATVEGLERLFGLTTLQARELVHSVPRVVKRRVPADQIARYERALTELGAVYELRPRAISPTPIIAVGEVDEPPNAAQSGSTLNLPAPRLDPLKPAASVPPPSSGRTSLSAPPPPAASVPPPATERAVDDTLVDPPTMLAGRHRTVRVFDGASGATSAALDAADAVRGATAATMLSQRTLVNASASTRPEGSFAPFTAPEPAVARPSDPPPPSGWAGLEPEPPPTEVRAALTPSVAWAALEPAPEPELPRLDPPLAPPAAPSDAGTPPPADDASFALDGRVGWVEDLGAGDESGRFDAPRRALRRAPVRPRRPGAVAAEPRPQERAPAAAEPPLARAALAASGSRRSVRVGIRTLGQPVTAESTSLPVQMAVRAGLGAALFLVLMGVRHVAPLGSNVERALAQWEHSGEGGGRGLPALDWMRVGNHQFIVVDKDAVTHFVEQLEHAGATEVYATDIVRSGALSIARSLLVELPNDASARKRVFARARDYANDPGAFDDVGQSTIKIPL